MNKLYYGDCLDVLRDHIPDSSIDLVYIDPPFNSNRDYNIVYDGAMAQAKAFSDTWSLHNLHEEKQLIFKREPQRYAALHSIVDAFEKLLTGTNPAMLGYLLNMGIRLVELHRVLKDTGSLFLHCDPTASHYLKILLDEIFKRTNFRNEIIWHYRRWTGEAKAFLRMHDCILFYAKDIDKVYFNPLFTEYTSRSLERKKHYHTRIKNKEVFVTSINAKGVKENDVWKNQYLNSQSKERLGYPTQKPLALLERIVKASCPENGVLLDAFCGCGTSVVAARMLNRRFIGIDITYLAIDLIKRRLIDAFYHDEKNFDDDVKLFGIPHDIEGARALAKSDKLRKEFEKWAVFKVGGIYTEKKGADTGFDGYFFLWDLKETKIKGFIQVKSGHVGVSQLRDFNGTLEREDAKLGYFVTLEKPTRQMHEEIDKLGKFTSRIGKVYNRIYIITVEDIFEGKLPEMPIGRLTKKAERHKPASDNEINMEFE